MPVDLSGEHRAGLIRIATHGDNGFHRLLEKIVHVLAVVPTDIEANLPHHFDAEGVHVSGGIRARAGDLKKVPGGCPKNALREMTAAGITRTEYENEWFSCGIHKTYPQQPESGAQQDEGALTGIGVAR